MSNYETFVKTYSEQLEKLANEDPAYFAAPLGSTYQIQGNLGVTTKVMPSANELAIKMTAGLKDGKANHDGLAIKRTCKILGIKHTRKAISEYLK